MRHAARLPPPPVFNDRRLLQLIAFCKLQLSIIVLVSAFFICGWLLHTSADFCIVYSWCLLSIRFVSGDIGNLQSLLQTCVRNASTIMQQSIKSHAKSIQNRRNWCQGALRKRPWEQVGSRLLKKALHRARNLRFLVPLGRFWAPFWPQLGAKGLPKSRFLTPSRTKI